MKYDTYHLALYGERTWSLAEKGAGRSKSLQTGMDCCCFCPQVTLTSKGTYLIEPIMPYVTDSGTCQCAISSLWGYEIVCQDKAGD